jgi:CSLREA domain-containing protein
MYFQSNWSRHTVRAGIVTLALAFSLLEYDPRTAHGATFVVNVAGDTNDGACQPYNPVNPGPDCTLREAIIAANSTPAFDTINFGGLFAVSTVLTITPSSELPTVLFPTVIDGSTAGAGRVNLDGSDAGSLASGLRLIGGSTVRGFAIYDFAAGITVSGGSGNLIENNYVGINADQSLAGNDFGVYIDDSDGNIIGGTTAAKRNVISGNSIVGVQINFAGSTGNTVVGNYIGTNVNGTGAKPNNIGVGVGYEASGNTIGGDDVGERNVISGNGTGVIVLYDATGNSIEGNFIGTRASGWPAIPNTNGVVLDAPGNDVGGFASPVGDPPANVISGNTEAGVLLNDEGTGSQVQGNIIGLDYTAEEPLPNGDGIVLDGNHGSSIGGVLLGTRNIISGNSGAGVLSRGASYDNSIKGNRIGTDGEGTFAVGNVWGVRLEDGTEDTVIGGITSRESNVIAGNGVGVSITEGSNGNILQGNRIGTDSLGTMAIPNGLGIEINGASDNVIGGSEGTTPGGPCTGACNLISGNGNSSDDLAIGILGPDASFNEVLGNYIGTNAEGTAALSNEGTGILVLNSAGTDIGGAQPGEGNVVSGTEGDGIVILGPGSVSSTVQGNFVGTNAAGNAPIPNEGTGIFVAAGASANTIGGTGGGNGNVIAYHASGPGVQVNGADEVSIRGNSIHSNETGIDLVGSANNNQAAPVLVSAVNGSTHIVGALDSSPGAFRIEFFANSECDGSGFGEGETYLGFAALTTDGAGHASIDVTLPGTAAAGEVITATATDADENTSEFSNCVTVTGAATPTPTPTPSATPIPTLPSDTPTESATPTATAAPLTQGDDNCDGHIDNDDVLAALQATAALPYLQFGDCPSIGGPATAGLAGGALFGDVNCDGDADAKDALSILLFALGLSPLPEAAPCPDIGTPL